MFGDKQGDKNGLHEQRKRSINSQRIKNNISKH
jgi:hypothetical protein